jgi:hypothetical protein
VSPPATQSFGGGINLAGGDNFQNGGPVALEGGVSNEGNGGPVVLSGGAGLLTGGDIIIQGGNTINGISGSITLSVGSVIGSGTLGTIVFDGTVQGPAVEVNVTAATSVTIPSNIIPSVYVMYGTPAGSFGLFLPTAGAPGTVIHVLNRTSQSTTGTVIAPNSGSIFAYSAAAPAGYFKVN